LYKHKNTGHFVAAEELRQSKRADDEWAQRYGRPGKGMVTGDFAVWRGGRYVTYMDRATFQAQYEAI
jgi:hypothetical protein